MPSGDRAVLQRPHQRRVHNKSRRALSRQQHYAFPRTTIYRRLCETNSFPVSVLMRVGGPAELLFRHDVIATRFDTYPIFGEQE
jgi:hypothetical protein